MYLDANFFIFANVAMDRHGQKARMILKEMKEGKQGVTSVLTLGEVLWVLRRNGRTADMRAVLEWIYNISNLHIREVSPLTPMRALAFIEKYNLKPRDAFHVAIMEELGINHIVTDNKDFDKIKGVKRIAL